jgi:hypothetical protein
MFYSCGNLEKGGEYVRNLVFPSGDGFNAGGAPPYYNNG